MTTITTITTTTGSTYTLARGIITAQRTPNHPLGGADQDVFSSWVLTDVNNGARLHVDTARGPMTTSPITGMVTDEVCCRECGSDDVDTLAGFAFSCRDCGYIPIGKHLRDTEHDPNYTDPCDCGCHAPEGTPTMIPTWEHPTGVMCCDCY